jgi:hypothetical protein
VYRLGAAPATIRVAVVPAINDPLAELIALDATFLRAHPRRSAFALLVRWVAGIVIATRTVEKYSPGRNDG